MNTATIEKESITNEITRKITDTYTVGNYRVTVQTKHDKTRKAYLTTISECQIQKNDGYTMEFHSVFTDYFKTIKAEKVSRYSLNTLIQFHNSTAQEAAVIVNDLLNSNNKKEGE
jgi:hypothetical protein